MDADKFFVASRTSLAMARVVRQFDGDVAKDYMADAIKSIVLATGYPPNHGQHGHWAIKNEPVLAAVCALAHGLRVREAAAYKQHAMVLEEWRKTRAPNEFFCPEFPVALIGELRDVGDELVQLMNVGLHDSRWYVNDEYELREAPWASLSARRAQATIC